MHSPNQYEVLFYEKADGECLVEKFLDRLPKKVKAKIYKWIEQLEVYGPALPRPYADTVRDKIRELRVRFGNVRIRLLYFFVGKKIVITHAFMKKSDEIPQEEIERSLSIMNDFYERLKKGGETL